MMPVRASLRKWRSRCRFSRDLLERVADRELEEHRFLVREPLDWEAPLEAERPEGRLPADTEAHRCPQREQVTRREARAGDEVRRRRPTIPLLEVPRVPQIGEEHPAQVQRLEDRKLE